MQPSGTTGTTITGVADIGSNQIYVAFDWVATPNGGPWTIEYDDGGGFQPAISSSSLSLTEVMFQTATSGPGMPWRILSDNGDITFLNPPLLGLPYTGGTL